MREPRFDKETMDDVLRRLGQPRKPRRRWLRNILLFLAGMLVPILLCSFTVLRCVKVDGDAMLPTLRTGDRVIVLPKSFSAKATPARGDVVMLQTPPQAGVTEPLMTRRVVGLPGDTLEVKEGKLYRNGRQVDEEYIREGMWYEWGPVSCLPEHVVLLGDNRNEAEDSHTWAAGAMPEESVLAPLVPLQSLRGMLLFRIYPPHRMGAVNRR